MITVHPNAKALRAANVGRLSESTIGVGRLSESTIGVGRLSDSTIGVGRLSESTISCTARSPAGIWRRRASAVNHRPRPDGSRKQ